MSHSEGDGRVSRRGIMATHPIWAAYEAGQADRGQVLDAFFDCLMTPNEAMMEAARRVNAKFTGHGEIRTRAVHRAIIQAAKE